MEQEKTNFIRPDHRKKTNKRDCYRSDQSLCRTIKWGDAIDISVLNKLGEEQRNYWEFDEE